MLSQQSRIPDTVPADGRRPIAEQAWVETSSSGSVFQLSRDMTVAGVVVQAGSIYLVSIRITLYVLCFHLY